MAEETDQDDKTEDPTQKRLDDALKEGNIVYSPEVGAFFVLLVGAALVLAMAPAMSRDLALLMRALIEDAANAATDADALRGLFAGLAVQIGLAMAGFIGALLVAGVAARYVQDRPSFTAARLKPKLEHLDPIKGFGRVFGPAAFGQFGKAVLKVLVVGAAVTWALWPRDRNLEALVRVDVASLLAVAQDKIAEVFIACLIAFGALALADYVFAFQAHRKRLRMSREDIKREFKESEGDPQVKARIRQIRMERARRRMLQQVPLATVVVTNPTHFAVALKYEQGRTAAPICVAKGADDLALRIRSIAEEHEVPVVEDPPLARALYAAAELDKIIPRQHFEAVAKVIGVVLALAQKRGRR